MASNYGLNFGFLRSDESVRWTEGRFRTPVGETLLQGTVVEVDAADPAFMKAGAAEAAPVAGYCGLLIQELDFERSIYESDAYAMDSFQIGTTKGNRLSVITGGAGVKVWLANTPAVSRADGRQISAVTMFAGSPAVGDDLFWDGTKFDVVAAGETPFAKVVHTPSANRVEIVLYA